MTTLDEAVSCACDEAEDVLDAFVFMAIWETDRAVQQARQDKGKYETCFRVVFEAVTKEWQRRKALKGSDSVCSPG